MYSLFFIHQLKLQKQYIQTNQSLPNVFNEIYESSIKSDPRKIFTNPPSKIVDIHQFLPGGKLRTSILEERVNRSSFRAPIGAAWRPRGSMIHWAERQFIGYADAAVLHPRGFTPLPRPPSDRLHPTRGVENVAGGATYCVRSRKERAENEWAKKTFSGVRSTTPRQPREDR